MAAYLTAVRTFHPRTESLGTETLYHDPTPTPFPSKLAYP